MVERVRTICTRLFEVRVLHHYWLDDGKNDLQSLAPAVRDRRLLEYDVRGILRLEPSAATRTLIAGLRGVFRTSGLGLLVAVPVDAVVPLDASFEFFASPVDPAYADYTAGTLQRMPIVDVIDPDDPEVGRRYKAAVPVLSNAAGQSRGAGTGIRRFLSSPYRTAADATDPIEGLIDAGGTLQLLTSDPPASTNDLGAVADKPFYVHQGDTPPLVAPAGFSGVPATGIEMTPDTPQDVVAVIRILPRPGDGITFHIVDADGRPLSPSRVFEVHLRNRWTIRRYRSPKTGAVVSTEADELPLTRFDSARTKRPPSPPLFQPEQDPADPERTARLVSDIYA